MKKLLFILCPLILLSCNNKEISENKKLTTGSQYLFQLHISETDSELTIPFQVTVENPQKLIFHNAEEQIEVTDVNYSGDSIFITMPVFGSEFKGLIKEEALSGYWHNYNKEDYSIPFTATKGDLPRFAAGAPSYNFTGKYEVTFFDEEGNTTPAIGDFVQQANTITGTFLTETGDYRYLEGNVIGNSMKLSTFDGAHAFVFEAIAEESGTLDGRFYSRKHWVESWSAQKNENAKLGDAYTLTKLLPGKKIVSFEFPKVNGEILKFPSKEYTGKVTLLQILGTWCPNCMDETRYYTSLYDKYHEQGLEIISLDFEPTPTLDYFKPRAERFKKDLGVNWPVVLAGPSDKSEAVKSLPMLNHILSYPTTIFIDKDGAARSIHTGFTGPGTGESYTTFTSNTEQLIQTMLNE